MDTAGFHALESARAWLDRRRRLIVQTSPAVRRVLDASGAPRHMEFVDHVTPSR